MKKNASAILLVAAIFAALVALNFAFITEDNDDQENEQAASRSSYRTTLYGTHAFYTLLEESGYTVTRLQMPFTDVAELYKIGTLVVVAPPAAHNPSEEEFARLTEWVEAGGLLIVIDREIDVSFGETSITTSQSTFQSTLAPLQPTLYTHDVEQVEVSNFATNVHIENGYYTYHVGAGGDAVLADAQIGEGRVVLLSDPFIVANNGIARADNATLALNLFKNRPDGPVAFDEFHHGYSAEGSGGLISYFSGTPIPWILWQSVFVAALVVYTYGRRFARAIPLKRERRTTNLEFVSSMANITRLARATDLAVESIYSEFRKRLCRYNGLPAKIDNDQLARATARRARMDEAEVRAVLVSCERVAAGEPISDARLLSLVTRVRDIESKLKI